MTITFITGDGDETAHTGFQAQYSGDLEGCGGLVRSAVGKLHSPNYPNDYPADSNCQYTVATNPGNGMTLAFEDFELEETVDCTRDSVQLFDGV